MKPHYNSDDADIVVALELMLASTFSTEQDGWSSHFFVGGGSSAPFWARGATAFMSHTRIGLLEAALHIRRIGPNYLRSLSIRALQKLLIDFLVGSYPLMANEVRLCRDGVAFDQVISADTKRALAAALVQSSIFTPINEVTLFPLVPVVVDDDFVAEPFFLVRPSSLTHDLLRTAPDQRRTLLADRFPPWSDWPGDTGFPGAWLGARAPIVSRALRMRSAVLGALALALPPRHCYLFSMRDMFGGWVVAGSSYVTSVRAEGHTPPLGYNVAITAADHRWLALLAEKIESSDALARRHMNALEYFYRAWPLSEVERFPILFMVLDAVFGDPSQATAAIVEAVVPIMGPDYDAARIRRLLKLRAAVIHGGAPEIYDSSRYGEYYRDFLVDPVQDLESITARSLSWAIFSGAQVGKAESDYRTL